MHALGVRPRAVPRRSTPCMECKFRQSGRPGSHIARLPVANQLRPRLTVVGLRIKVVGLFLVVCTHEFTGRNGLPSSAQHQFEVAGVQGSVHDLNLGARTFGVSFRGSTLKTKSLSTTPFGCRPQRKVHVSIGNNNTNCCSTSASIHSSIRL